MGKEHIDGLEQKARYLTIILLVGLNYGCDKILKDVSINPDCEDLCVGEAVHNFWGNVERKISSDAVNAPGLYKIGIENFRLLKTLVGVSANPSTGDLKAMLLDYMHTSGSSISDSNWSAMRGKFSELQKDFLSLEASGKINFFIDKIVAGNSEQKPFILADAYDALLNSLDIVDLRAKLNLILKQWKAE